MSPTRMPTRSLDSTTTCANAFTARSSRALPALAALRPLAPAAPRPLASWSTRPSRQADEFNRAQRSHQNYMEMLDSYIAMTLLGGLKHPIACATGSIFFCLGCIFYQKVRERGLFPERPEEC